MRCRVDKSCKADAEALGFAPKYHWTLIVLARELRPDTIRHVKSSLSQRRFMYEESDVLLEGSMQEGYAWMERIDESAWKEFGTLFFNGAGVLYEYWRKAPVTWK
jgi:hypothetical protein